MISSLYSGTTGMQANSVAMGVVGSNIANVNTIGFKTGTASFANILSQNLSQAVQYRAFFIVQHIYLAEDLLQSLFNAYHVSHLPWLVPLPSPGQPRY